MKKVFGFFSLFIAAFSFGSFGVWIRLLNYQMSIYQQVVLRNIFAFLIIILIILISKELRKTNWEKIKKINLFLYTLIIPLSVVGFNISMINTKIAVATFAFYIGTILTGWLAGLMFYKEKLNIEKWLSLILVIIGLCLFIYPFTKTSVNFGFIAGIVAGIFDGIANGFRKNLAGKISKPFLVLLTTIGGVLVSGLMMTYFQQNLNFISTMPTITWIIGAFFGFLLVINNYLLLVGFQNFDLGLGSIVLSLELLFALIFGIIFFKEMPTSKELMGGLFILIANIIPNIKTIIRKRG